VNYPFPKVPIVRLLVLSDIYKKTINVKHLNLFSVILILTGRPCDSSRCVSSQSLSDVSNKLVTAFGFFQHTIHFVVIFKPIKSTYVNVDIFSYQGIRKRALKRIKHQILAF
jgi:hypothetical protein